MGKIDQSPLFVLVVKLVLDGLADRQFAIDTINEFTKDSFLNWEELDKFIGAYNALKLLQDGKFEPIVMRTLAK